MSTNVEELKKQVIELQKLMENERKQHAAAAQEANDRIRQLEERLIESDQKKFAKLKEQRSASAQGSPTKGSPTNATSNRPGTAGSPANVSATKTTSVTNGSISTPPATPNSNAKAAAGGRFSKKSPSQGATSGAAGGGKQVSLTNGSTALQHAWDKFCVRAMGDFSPKELSLMSLETIKSLLQHYNYSNPVEIAQIEAQWALIQDGEKAVTAPTPFVSPNKRARSFSPMPVKEDFDLRTTVLKPHLSKRTLVNPDPPAGSNPLGACEHHAPDKPRSKGATLKEAPLSSNPNECSPDRYKANPLGKRSLGVSGVFPFTHKVYPRGKSRAFSPDPKPITTYPTETGPEPRMGGQKLASVVPPWPYKERVESVKMINPVIHDEPKKSSIRHFPQKDQIVLG